MNPACPPVCEWYWPLPGCAYRQKHLRAADAHLNKLRLYLRLAHRWK
jgi:hypothetical protein